MDKDDKKNNDDFYDKILPPGVMISIMVAAFIY